MINVDDFSLFFGETTMLKVKSDVVADWVGCRFMEEKGVVVAVGDEGRHVEVAFVRLTGGRTATFRKIFNRRETVRSEDSRASSSINKLEAC
ncbi:hypothetical protein L1987_76237 [Smallanthus sonchifolius]|uniref:Uncharacterized protein n=1 Tax=Smallanthus sonchifolius TaxID=185202 RepID=A0ACB9AC27_9ASTR|nr:hypothetical protein L1987_76237 [Smallanthus sonchifolius]